MADITINDIAKKAGVAKSTVSRVINNRGYVKEDTRQRIEAIMREHDYMPSATARSLSMQESSTVALILPESDNSFFSGIIKGVSSVLIRQGLTLILSYTENDPEADLMTLQNIRQQRVRGIIYTPATEYRDDPMGDDVRRILGEMGTPVVLLDRNIWGAEIDGVFSNNFEGAYAATNALIQAGHTNIGIIAGDLNLYIGRERLLGYRQAMQNAGLAVADHQIVKGEFNTEVTYRLVSKILEAPHCPSAFFACNNLSSKGLLRAVHERGLRIPEDIAYVGFDPVDGLDIFGLEYSCLDRNVFNMGVEAATLLLRRAENPKKAYESVILTPILRLKGSEKYVAAPAQAQKGLENGPRTGNLCQ